ncbi:MAG: outer membrane protein assembly factor BamB [Bermanella sp.]
MLRSNSFCRYEIVRNKEKFMRFTLLLLALSLTGGGAAEDFSAQHAPGYAQTSWASVHGDASNSDYVPLILSTELQPQWLALKGSVSLTAPSVAADGSLYITTGRGKGYSHLHALNRDGELLWEAAPEQSLDDLDAMAVISAPIIDVDGDLYVSDSNQLWAFHADGRIKWVTSLVSHGINEPFVTAIFAGAKGQFVGGVSADGKVALFSRSSGELALPVLALPGIDGPEGPKVPKALWAEGLMAEDIREASWKLLRGYRYRVTNTAALHSGSGRIFITATGTNADHGQLIGIDVSNEALTMAFATQVPPNSGTSPALSPNGRQVYAIGGAGILYAVDNLSGKLLWQVEIEGQDASPSVGPDNTIYVLGGDELVAVDGRDGETLWRRNYRDWARERHPKLWPRFGLIGSRGKADAYVDSVVTVSNGLLWTTLLVGYEINLPGRDFVHPAQTYLVALDPSNGTVLEEWRIPDSSEGGISISPTGDVYLNLLSAQASIAFYGGYQWLLPQTVRRPRPRGGVYALSPVSLNEQLMVGIQWLDTLAINRNTLFLDNIQSQLWATRRTVALAIAQQQLDAALGRHVQALLEQAGSRLDSCRSDEQACTHLFAKLRAIADALL